MKTKTGNRNVIDSLKKVNKDVKIVITIGGIVWREDWYKKLSEKEINEVEDAMDNCGEQDEKDEIF